MCADKLSTSQAICHAALDIVENNPNVVIVFPVHLNPNVRAVVFSMYVYSGTAAQIGISVWIVLFGFGLLCDVRILRPKCFDVSMPFEVLELACHMECTHFPQ